MTKAIEMIKNIIESYLWYDGEVYPIVDDTNQVDYATTGTRMGNYSGNTNWLKLVSTYAYKDYTITLNPDVGLNVNAPDENNNIVVNYNDGVSTQTEIAAALQASAYITTATAANASGVVTSDEDVGTLRGGKFVVKRKEGGHVEMDVDQGELYNVKCESDSEENVKRMITNLRLLNNDINSYSYKWTITNSDWPFSLKFTNADDKENKGNNEFIITISLKAVSTL